VAVKVPELVVEPVICTPGVDVLTSRIVLLVLFWTWKAVEEFVEVAIVSPVLDKSDDTAPATLLVVLEAFVEPIVIAWAAPLEVPMLMVVALAVVPVGPITMAPVLPTCSDKAVPPVPPWIRVWVAAVVLPTPIVVELVVPKSTVPVLEVLRIRVLVPPAATVRAPVALRVVLVPKDTIPEPDWMVMFCVPKELRFRAPWLAAVEVAWIKSEVPLVPWTSKMSAVGDPADVCLTTAELMFVVGAKVLVPVKVWVAFR